jgi:hypothetical protein
MDFAMTVVGGLRKPVSSEEWDRIGKRKTWVLTAGTSPPQIGYWWGL